MSYLQYQEHKDELPEPPANLGADNQCPACSCEVFELHECTFCLGKFCYQCFAGAAKEVNGGLDVRGTGLNCCYACGEQDAVQAEIHREVIALLDGQLQRIEREYHTNADALGKEIEQARKRLSEMKAK